MELVVDHCHTSHTVRGLLCVACNAAIGHVRDDPEVAAAADVYLRRPPRPNSERPGC
ncbi:endonuclease domain-containing protein [Actinoplanes sp. CA-054009]